MAALAKDDLSKRMARIEILSNLLSYPTISQKDWTYNGFGSEAVKVGDLVSMSSAPASEFYLSWLLEIREKDGGFTEYLLESIESGKLCWWSNIGINYYNRDRVSACWKWTDRQFKFNNRWLKHCHHKHGAYIVLPCGAAFDGRKVSLSLRIRFGLGDGFSHSIEYEDFRKVTKAMMSEFYLSGVEKHTAQLDKIKAARETA